MIDVVEARLELARIDAQHLPLNGVVEIERVEWRRTLTPEQFHVLRYVRRGPGSMSELAAAKNISRPAISQAAEILVKKGLVKRVGRPQDRRYVDLELTRAGNELLDTVFDETRAWMKQRMKALSREELQSIIRAMAALKKILEQPASIPARPA